MHFPKFLICLLALMIAFAITSVAQPPKTMSPSELKADLAILRRAYEELHPGLYRYNTRQQMDRHFAELDKAFSRDLTLREAYLELSKFLAKVKCGHTYANFYNQPKSVVEAVFKGKDRVPFYFRWVDGSMIVTRNYSSSDVLKPGAEVVEINRIPARRILETLMTIARSDGSNDAKRIAYLEVSGVDRWEAFDIFLPLFYPQTGSELEIKVRQRPNAKPVSITVSALTDDERLAAMKGRDKAAGGLENIFTLEYPQRLTAVLRMPTWALYNSKWNWRKWIDDTFDELIDKNIETLVLDIRQNEGGQDVGDTIISRIAGSEIALSEVQRLVRYRQVPSDLKPYLETWDRSFDDWGASAVGSTDGFYRLTRYDDDRRGTIIKPKGRRFEGKVFVLVGAVNSSATFQFAQAVKLNKLGTLVGQMTGGNQRGINGGAFYFLRLPNTKLEADLPLIGQFSHREAPDAGIQPDVYVKPSVSDIAAGRDTELGAALYLARKGR